MALDHRLGSWAAREGESELSAGVHLSLLPECEHSATSRLTALLPWFFHSDGCAFTL